MIRRDKRGRILPQLNQKNIIKMLKLEAGVNQQTISRALNAKVRSDETLRYNLCSMAGAPHAISDRRLVRTIEKQIKFN